MKTHGKQILSKANFTQRRYMHTSGNMMSSHSLKKNHFFKKSQKNALSHYITVVWVTLPEHPKDVKDGPKAGSKGRNQ